MGNLPADETEISVEWLDAQLRAAGIDAGVTAVRAERFAQGVGLMARLARLHVSYARTAKNAPATLIAKFPSDSPQSLQLAQLYRFYERECSFYTELGAHTPLRIPRCYAAPHEGQGSFVLLLEDFAGARVGDQVAGNSAQAAREAVLKLAEHHALFWEQTAPLEFLVDYHDDLFCQVLDVSYRNAVGPVLEGYAAHFTPAMRELTLAVADRTTAFLKRNPNRPLTVCHGDFRADNLFYDLPDGSGPGVIDFQITGRGFGPFDVAYHLTQSVSSEVRRAIERPLLEAYHGVLCERGVRSFSFSDLWQEYRKDALFALVYPITVCGALDLSNPRAKALGEVFLKRSLDAISDLGAVDTLDL